MKVEGKGTDEGQKVKGGEVMKESRKKEGEVGEVKGFSNVPVVTKYTKQNIQYITVTPEASMKADPPAPVQYFCVFLWCSCV